MTTHDLLTALDFRSLGTQVRRYSGGAQETVEVWIRDKVGHNITLSIRADADATAITDAIYEAGAAHERRSLADDWKRVTDRLRPRSELIVKHTRAFPKPLIDCPHCGSMPPLTHEVAVDGIDHVMRTCAACTHAWHASDRDAWHLDHQAHHGLIAA